MNTTLSKKGQLPPFTASHLKAGLRTSWTAEQIGRLAIKYESEWYADSSLSKWNEIDHFYQTACENKRQRILAELDECHITKPAEREYPLKLLNEQYQSHIDTWQIEKAQRIKPSLWWDEVAKAQASPTTNTDTATTDNTPVLSNLSLDGKAWYLHPVEMDHFITREHPVIKLNGDDYELKFLSLRENLELLDDEDYELVASQLGCEAKALKAVGIKETKDKSYYTHLGDDVPKILFERHYFHRLTNGRYDYDSDISHRSAFSKYGSYTMQYQRLLKAYDLSPREALMSASWGKFQVMGANMHSNELSIESILLQISLTEKNHLITLKGYLLKNNLALKALKSKDWSKFALYYNGSAYKKNRYDILIEEIYNNL